MTAPILIFAQGPPAWASSRIRGYWLEEAAPDLFEVYREGRDPDLNNRKLTIFQKRHDDQSLLLAQQCKTAGCKIVYDITDPLWWFDPAHVTAMMAQADVVTVSNDGLLSHVESLPVVKRSVCIPDRMLPAYHPTVREHNDHNPVVLVWYGMAANRLSLGYCSPILNYVALLGHEFVLRVIDDQPGLQFGADAAYPVEHVAWTLETFHANLTDADIALTPPYPGAWGEMKSDNKAVTAWWAGLPTTTGYGPDEVVRLIKDADLRAKEGRENRRVAETEYDIAASVEEWRALLAELGADDGG